MSQLVLSQPFSGRFSFVVHVRLMVFLAVITVLIFALSPTLVSQAPAAMPSDLIFVPNMGQADASVQFQAHQGGNRWLFTQDAIIYSWVMAEENNEEFTDIPSLMPKFSTGTLRQQFLGTNDEAQFAAADPLAGKVNYLLGNDPTYWHTNLPTYATIGIQNLYSGIDVTYEDGYETFVTHFSIHPGATVDTIQWQYEGVQEVVFNMDGQANFILPNSMKNYSLGTPQATQIIKGLRTSVDIRYVQVANNLLGLRVGRYDPAYTLTITIASSTFSLSFDSVRSVVADASGHAYVAGYSYATDFPLVNPLQPNFAGEVDAFIAKLLPDGSGALFSTYLGGTGGDEAYSITVDDLGYITISGSTSSVDFPLIAPFQSSHNGSIDVFIARLTPDGSALTYSTYFGGSDLDQSERIIQDSTGDMYVTGLTHSPDIPLVNPLQGTQAGVSDIFVSKFSSDGQVLLFSTYLGGNDYDVATSIAVDNQNNVYVAGETRSDNFPLFNPLQNVYAGSTDGFVSKLTSDGQALVFSTYLGGYGSDHARAIITHSDGTASVSGYTSSQDFPVVNAYQPVSGGYSDIFITRFSPSGDTWLYSTYLGGSEGDYGLGLDIDDVDNYYVTAMTFSTDFPVVNAIQLTNGGYQDTVVAKLNASSNTLLFSTYVGGESSEFVSSIAIDPNQNVYVAGETWSGAYPTTPGAWQENYAGGGDGFVTKILADGSAFGYSTYLGGGFPTDVTVSGVSGTAYDGWRVGLLVGMAGLLVMGYFMVRRYQYRQKEIV